MSDQSQNQGSRPKAATVFGILNVIFASMGILGGLGGIAVMAGVNSLIRGFAGFSMSEYVAVAEMAASLMTLIIVLYLVTVVIDVLGLVGGIGLLGEKRWSILMTNIYAAATIALSFATYFIVRRMMGVIFENPLILEEVPPDERFIFSIFQRIIPAFTGVLSMIFGSAYPILLLVLLNRKNVREHYLGPKPAAGEAE
jgi:hypothetical protein